MLRQSALPGCQQLSWPGGLHHQELPDCRIATLPRCQNARLPVSRFAALLAAATLRQFALPGCQKPSRPGGLSHRELPDCRIAILPRCQLARLPALIFVVLLATVILRVFALRRRQQPRCRVTKATQGCRVASSLNCPIAGNLPASLGAVSMPRWMPRCPALGAILPNQLKAPLLGHQTTPTPSAARPAPR